MKILVLAAAIALTPAVALAQKNPEGAASGAAAGAVGGAIVGGPVGAAVGGLGGAVIGGIVGDNTPKFRKYVVEQRHPSYVYEGKLEAGVVLPGSGVTYYEVPEEYGARGYRYTVVNDTPVIVDPQTRRVIQVIE